MGFFRGSQDWDGDGKYDFFDRAMDVKNMELLQEQNKKVDEYQKRLREENSRSTTQTENCDYSEVGVGGVIFSIIIAIGGAILVFSGIISILDDTGSAATFLAFIIAAFAFMAFVGLGITIVEWLNKM